MFSREYLAWDSPALGGRRMELLVFGHAGARVLAFPTSLGRFHDWEDRGIVGALSEHLARGWIQLYCLDSVDGESWYAKHRPLGERARWQERYERYVLDEVLPLGDARGASPFTIAMGASFGAYHAIALALRHPWRVQRAIGMSGVYDLRVVTDGRTDGSVYFHNPPEFIANEHDPERIAALQRVELILAVGRDDPHARHNEEFSGLLWSRGIGNALRVWDGWAHDWDWWQQMVPRYIGGRD